MNKEQLEKVRNDDGFIAALDQSGGSTPKALKLYGINEDEYSGEEEMFAKMHEARSRLMKSPAFNGDRILGAIARKERIAIHEVLERVRSSFAQPATQKELALRVRTRSRRCDPWKRRPQPRPRRRVPVSALRR